MSSAAHVYEGPWTNWDQGSVLGARITLSSLKATILVAFIAIYVTRCGDQLWVIVQFALHQWRAGDQRDPMMAEQQFILRNCGISETILKSSKQIYHSRLRNDPPPASRRHLVRWSAQVIVIAGVISALATVAAGFSSQVTQAVDDHLLIRSPDCGFYTDLSVLHSFTPAAGFQARLQNSTRRADEYAQTCYNTTKSFNSLCRRFVQQEITWKANRTAKCPFAKGMCLGGDAAAFEMDTGKIDSHEVLGLNAPPKNRVIYRRETTCAPLVTKSPYAEIIAGNLPGEEYVLYYYGSVADLSNLSYQTSTYAQTGKSGYLLSGIAAPGGFTPIPEIARDDSVLSLFFLEQNKLAYTGPVDDLFFESHSNPTPHEVASGDVVTLFYNDKVVSVMACIDRHQICNPTSPNGTCTNFGPANILPAEFDQLRFNRAQNNTAYVIVMSILDGEMLNSIAGRGAAALKAQTTVFDNINTQLPKHQWTIEVGGWFNIALARLQHALLEYSTGPANIGDGSYQRVKTASIDRMYKTTCGIQKVRQFNFDRGYLSVSVLGLIIIFAVGGIITIVSLTLPSMVGRLQRQYGRGQERWVTWADDDKFQCRSAQEGAPQAGPIHELDNLVPLAGQSDTTIGIVNEPSLQHNPGSESGLQTNSHNNQTFPTPPQTPSTSIPPVLSTPAASPMYPASLPPQGASAESTPAEHSSSDHSTSQPLTSG